MFEIGLLNVAWWIPLGWFALSSHLTNVSTTIYLHRCMSHGGVKLSPAVSLPMRFWLWFTTGIHTKEWVACHRKHHAHVDREGDPHSPVLAGLLAILFGGWIYYRRAVRSDETLEKYSKGTPDDWFERQIFTKLRSLGIVLLLAVDCVALGWGWGIGVWIAQMLLMPIQAGIVNGIGHAWGYRNYEIKDNSRNFLPVGLALVGEELHNNHHADPRSAKFSARPFELDIGWVYIKLLAALGLAKVKYARD